MTDRAEPDTPQFVTFQPWRIRAAIAVAFFVVMMVVFASMPDGPWNLWRMLVFVAGFMTYSMVVNRSVVIRLEEQAVDIRQGWRKARIPYEEITEVAVGPRTPWWQIGRRRLDDGATGYLMSGPSVRISTDEESVVVSAKESHRVAGAILRQLKHVAEGREAGTGQTGR